MPALLVCLLVLFGGVASAARSGPAPRPAPRGPEGSDVRLVVVLGVDQLIPEQLDRLEAFLPGGLGRFAREGTVFSEALLGHGITETGPGYATLGTGVHPSRHGIVSNQWFGPEGDGVYCMSDPAATVLGASGALAGRGLSPANVRVAALGDHLRAAHPDSLVVAVSGKDRAAIGLAGRRPDACVWWGLDAGGFATSSWYGEALPEWIRPLDEAWPQRFGAGEPWGEAWEPTSPAGIERVGSLPDERPGEAPRAGVRQLLVAARSADGPRRRALLARYVFLTPRVDELVVEAGAEAVRALGLGADEHPDALLLGLSACDILGHSHGPYSAEVTDLLLRLDAALGALFELLDAEVGEGRWVAALTADHGVLPLPSEARRRGYDARVYPDSVVEETVGAVRARLEAELGRDFVKAFDADGIRLDRAALREAGVDHAVARALAAEAARGSGEWLARAYTLEELAGGLDADDLWLSLMARSYDAERSPDVAFVRREGSLVGSSAATSHGTPYRYDRRVALAFLGAGIPRGRRGDLAQTVDVVPTLLHGLGIAPPEGLDGRALFAD